MQLDYFFVIKSYCPNADLFGNDAPRTENVSFIHSVFYIFVKLIFFLPIGVVVVRCDDVQVFYVTFNQLVQFALPENVIVSMQCHGARLASSASAIAGARIAGQRILRRGHGQGRITVRTTLPASGCDQLVEWLKVGAEIKTRPSPVEQNQNGKS